MPVPARRHSVLGVVDVEYFSILSEIFSEIGVFLPLSFSFFDSAKKTARRHVLQYVHLLSGRQIVGEF